VHEPDFSRHLLFAGKVDTVLSLSGKIPALA
jgi:hypothetical protein